MKTRRTQLMAPTTPANKKFVQKFVPDNPAKRGICAKICSITPQKTVVYAKILTVCEIYPNNLQNRCFCKKFRPPVKTVVYAKISTACKNCRLCKNFDSLCWGPLIIVKRKK